MNYRFNGRKFIEFVTTAIILTNNNIYLREQITLFRNYVPFPCFLTFK